MTILEAVILGIVEGVTEFLPISSTFHLIWTSRLFGIEQTPFQTLFEVAIQSGAILAVLIPFIRAIKQDTSLLLKVIVAFIPTGIIGVLLYPLIKDVFFGNSRLQLYLFVIIGILFILFEYLRKQPYTRTIAHITYSEAFIVGIAQSLAIIPGVSRAGAVMLALMALSYKREDAARFSFFIAIPTIMSASVFDLVVSQHVVQSPENWITLAIGFFVAFGTSLVIVHWFIKYLSHHTISIFGWYRIILAASIILLLL